MSDLERFNEELQAEAERKARRERRGTLVDVAMEKIRNDERQAAIEAEAAARVEAERSA